MARPVYAQAPIAIDTNLRAGRINNNILPRLDGHDARDRPTRLDESRFWPMVHQLNLTSYERLLRRGAAAKSLSGCGRLYHRRGIYYSNRLRRFSRVAVAKLGISPGSRAFADWVPDCAHPCMGLRRHAARNSGHAN